MFCCCSWLLFVENSNSANTNSRHYPRSETGHITGNHQWSTSLLNDGSELSGFMKDCFYFYLQFPHPPILFRHSIRSMCSFVENLKWKWMDLWTPEWWQLNHRQRKHHISKKNWCVDIWENTTQHNAIAGYDCWLREKPSTFWPPWTFLASPLVLCEALQSCMSLQKSLATKLWEKKAHCKQLWYLSPTLVLTQQH